MPEAPQSDRAVADEAAPQHLNRRPDGGMLLPSTTGAAVYAAQEEAQEVADDDGLMSQDEKLAPEEVARFVAKVLDNWGVEDRPAIDFDVPDVHEAAGWADSAGIHLHPRLCRPWTVLHELAHWVDVRQGHGPRFCANFLNLIKVHYEPEVAMVLLGAFERHDVLVDEDELDDDLWLALYGFDGRHDS